MSDGGSIQFPDRAPDEARTWDEDGQRHTVEIWREPDGTTYERRVSEPIPVEETIEWLERHDAERGG